MTTSAHPAGESGTVSAEYDIVHYRPAFRSQVVEVLQHLWGDDPDANDSYFQWKYCDNPHTGSPLGIVALCDGRVVGFRGYFAARFEIAGRDEGIVVLRPGDTCVHPDHRRKGLSVAMGNLAMEEYAPAYRLFFNFSCTRASLPGYLRMGFLPLAKKVYVTRCGLLGLVRYILAAQQDRPLEASKIEFGRFGDILVADAPRPEEMATIVAGQGRRDGRLRLLQDRDFFRWRFSSRRHKYAFYYLMSDDVARGYVVMGLSPNNRRGYILDYAGRDSGAIREILEYVIDAKHFDILSIYGFCLDDDLGRDLRALGFTTKSLVRIIERRLHGELPLLIRPVKEPCVEDDLFVEGIDVRQVGSWSLKPICSDAA